MGMQKKIFYEEKIMNEQNNIPDKIKIRGARVHNLKNINLDVPLNKIVGIAGVSGSGKSSLALGILYAEGSRRYLESLSTYTRRRMTQATKANLDEIKYIPAAIALHQRPNVPGIRSTFGTSTELLNILRLIYSRLASHCCPNKHYLKPSILVAWGKELICPECHVHFYAPSAEEIAFNSQGACEFCNGTGMTYKVEIEKLVPDKNLSIEQGAVAPWNSLMWSLMTDVCREMGVRTDIPFYMLTEKEKNIVYHGPAEKKHILYKAKNSNVAGEMDFTYYNAIYTVENALAKVKDEKGMKRVEKFLKQDICPKCNGTRFSEKARSPKIKNLSIDKACKMSLSEIINWIDEIPKSLPEEMNLMAKNLCANFFDVARPLINLGLGYISLDRSSLTLSTGELQRIQIARAVRNQTTGILYVLDEPTIGLHPANISGLNLIIKDLIRDGNSIVLVDHDTQILKECDWIIEMGPEAGKNGGEVIFQGTLENIKKDKKSRIGKFFLDESKFIKKSLAEEKIFECGEIYLSIGKIHTVKPMKVKIPKEKLTVVTGVSGSGKTTLILESLVPAIKNLSEKKKLPEHVFEIMAPGINKIKLIDATPIGINIRSTIATYANVHDELRKIYSRVGKYKAGDFSYNTGILRCENCDGTGIIKLDVQFLPDVEIICPECNGSRYKKDAYKIIYKNKKGVEKSLPEIMSMEINSALDFFCDEKNIFSRLKILQELGLGYLTLGESTPSLSGGEAQRLKLSNEINKTQGDSIFVFDEPTIGLHPLDTKKLIDVFEILIKNKATIVVIEHDLDFIRNADYIIDIGPGGGKLGGKIIALGPPDLIKKNKNSITGKFI